MVNFLKLIRWPNILMMGITQYAMRYLIILPAIEFPEVGLSLQLSFLHFNMLVISTLLIGASGYIINDYFDLKIDRFNKPDKMLLGTYISRKFAIKCHWVFTILGLSLALYVCYANHYGSLFYVFAFISGALWFYSTSYKHIPLIGNIIIATMVALVPLVISILDIKLIQTSQTDIIIESGYQLNDTIYLLLGFSGFAFIYNLIREIVKDLADFEGDKKSNSYSMPIAWGINVAKAISLFLLTIAICLLAYISLRYFSDYNSIFYIVFLFVIPSFYACYLIVMGKGRNDFLWASSVLKFILLFGILYAVVFYFKLTY